MNEFNDDFLFKDEPDETTPLDADNLNIALKNTRILKNFILNIINGNVDLIVKSIKSKNMFSGFVKGKEINVNNGQQQIKETSCITDYIEVDFDKNPNYFLSGLTSNLYSFIAFYNENKEYLGRSAASIRDEILINKDSLTNNKTSASGNIKYLIITQYENVNVSGKISDVDDLQVQLEIGDKATEYGLHQF